MWAGAGCTSGSQPAPRPIPTPTARILDPALVATGNAIAERYGCLVCHSADGFPTFGPTWKGLFGSTRTFDDGTTLVADDAYLAESIRSPTDKVVEGFAPFMPPQIPVAHEEIGAIIAYIESLR